MTIRPDARPPSRPHGLVWAAAVSALALGCGAPSVTDDAGTTPRELAECSQPENLAACTPSWEEFARNPPEQPPTLVGEPVQSEVQADLHNLEGDEDPEVTVQSDVTFSCTSETYSMATTPNKLVMYRPDATVLWPGGLVQGASYRDGGDFLALPIAERAPLEVIASINNDDNARMVDVPTAGSVGQAIGSMIGNAEAQGLATATSIDFVREEYHSESAFALGASLSARYLGFEASASGSVDTNASMTTVTAHLTQTVYSVSVATPPTPDDFFSSALTAEALQAQIDLGRIGPNNPPVFVSDVLYGRMMMYSVTAAASASEIRATIEASYENLSGSASGSLTTRQEKLLETATIRFVQVGGDQDSANRALRSGNLAEYFTERMPLTAAAPLQFTFKSLTGEVAHVTEAGEYTVTTCTPRLPGSLDFEAHQLVETGFTASERRSLVGDIDGDGIDDMVWNELVSGPQGANRVVVGFSSDSGELTGSEGDDSPQPSPPEGWVNFDVYVADTNGDGRSDLVWHTQDDWDLVWYVAVSRGDGTFEWTPRFVQTVELGWLRHTVHVDDANGDGRDDLLWVGHAAQELDPLRSVWRTHTGVYPFLSAVDGSLAPALFQGWVEERPSAFGADPGWRFHDSWIGDVNADGCSDLILNQANATGNSIVVSAQDCGTRTFGRPGVVSNRTVNGWDDYLPLVGNIDGSYGTDMAWVAPARGTVPVHRSLTDPSGAWSTPGSQSLTAAVPGAWHDPDASFAVLAADVNNDGRDDLILNQRTELDNVVVVGLGLSDGSFSYPAAELPHPSTPLDGWELYDVHTGDFNGDGRADVAWTLAGDPASTYIGLAR